MKWDFLKADTLPRPPPGALAVVSMGAIGFFTGLISSLPSPLPDMHLDDAGLLLNAKGVPLHAGIAFAAGVALMMWYWVTHDLAKCLLTMALTLIGWLAAVNTANDVFQATVGSELFGTAEGAKSSRETVGLLLAGLSGGAVGAGLTAFGSGIPAEPIRRPQSWILIVIVGTALGVLLYPAADLNALVILFVPWQALVAAAIAYGLIRSRRVHESTGRRRELFCAPPLRSIARHAGDPHRGLCRAAEPWRSFARDHRHGRAGNTARGAAPRVRPR